MLPIEPRNSQGSQRRTEDRTKLTEDEFTDSQIDALMTKVEGEAQVQEIQNPPETYLSNLTIDQVLQERQTMAGILKEPMLWGDFIRTIQITHNATEEKAQENLTCLEAIGWIEEYEEQEEIMIRFIRKRFTDQMQKLDKTMTLFIKYRNQERHLSEYLKRTTTWFIIGTEHCPKTGLYHAHISCTFRSKDAITVTKIVFPILHIEVTRNIEQSIQYCIKTSLYDKYGHVPEKNLLAKDQAYREIIVLCQRGQLQLIEQRYPKQFLQFQSVIQRLISNYEIQYLMQNQIILSREQLRRKNLFLFGLPNLGKTYVAATIAGPNAYEKTTGKWFDGFSHLNHTGITINDLQRSDPWPARTMNQLLDTWPFLIQIKNSMKTINPALLPIVMTSNYEFPELLQTYSNDPMMQRRITQAFNSRVTKVRFEKISTKELRITSWGETINFITRIEPYWSDQGVTITYRHVPYQEEV